MQPYPASLKSWAGAARGLAGVTSLFLSLLGVVGALAPDAAKGSTALEILLYGDPGQGVPVVEISCPSGIRRSRMIRPLGELAVAAGDGRALGFASPHAAATFPGTKFEISITRWQNEPRIVRLSVSDDVRYLPLAPGGTVAPEALVPDGLATRLPGGGWTVAFETALPPGEYAVITGSPTIANVYYEFSVERAGPAGSNKALAPGEPAMGRGR